MRPLPPDVEDCAEVNLADEHVQNLYRELRGRTIPWWPSETRADAVQRVAFRRNIRRPVGVIAERLDGAIERELATVTEYEDGGGAVTFVELPPSVAHARAEKERLRAERRAALLARAQGKAPEPGQGSRPATRSPIPTGKQGGLNSTQRGRKRLHPEEFVEVAPGKPGRPRKPVAPQPEKTVAESEATVFQPSSATGSTPPPRALAPEPPRGSPPLSGGEPEGSEAASKPVAPPPPPRKPVAPNAPTWESAAALAKLPTSSLGKRIHALFQHAARVLTLGSDAAALGARAVRDGYGAHDLAVIAWHWRADAEGALARMAPALRTTRLAYVTAVDLATHATLLAAEHAVAQAWWHGLTTTERQNIERGRPPPRKQPPLIQGQHYGPPANTGGVAPPAAAPASEELGPGLAKTGEKAPATAQAV